ncbi:MAG: hypothetical protein J7M17_06305 [Anaerolineae bacterium]|nr:hypothetical protein [Anaerolineae bacterium]
MEFRANREESEDRLKQFLTLHELLGPDWLLTEYVKPIEQWSLITGWISKSHEYPYDVWIADLDDALQFLKSKVLPEVWRVLERKMKAHHDRADSKGLLSEIATCIFLAHNDLPFDLERSLLSEGSKDVDISVCLDGFARLVHLEVQWLSPSARSERGAAAGAPYREFYKYNFPYEKYRVKGKIHGKTSKFTQSDITLVVLDCTTCPELGGMRDLCTISESAYEAFTGCDMAGNPTGYANSEMDREIRDKIDGVIWFQLEPGNSLMPLKRGALENHHSPHIGTDALRKFLDIWKSE